MVDAVCMIATGDVSCVSAKIDGNRHRSRFVWSMRASGPFFDVSGSGLREVSLVIIVAEGVLAIGRTVILLQDWPGTVRPNNIENNFRLAFGFSI